MENSKFCENCGIEFFKSNRQRLARFKKRRFCTKKCYNNSYEAKLNRSNNGKRVGIERKKNGHDWGFKISLSLKGKPRNYTKNEKHWAWKGNKAGKEALHLWVRKNKKNNGCEICGKTEGRIELSSKLHDYKRDINDWQYLCCSCHRKYDYIIRISRKILCQPLGY